jgi:hypothetical protein
MQIGRIVLKLRADKTSFGNNIYGAAELNLAVTNTLTGPEKFAFVIPVSEDVKENEYHPGVNQLVYERFAVIVALPSDTTQKDKTGIRAYDALHDARGELFRTLVGWDLGYDGMVYYRAGKMIGIDRAWLWYQFEFEYTARISSNPDGYGEMETTTVDDRKQVSQLPDFNDVWAQYILTPSVKWETLENGPEIHLPVTLVAADMTQFVDLTDDPNAGGYGTAFAHAFNFFVRS